MMVKRRGFRVWVSAVLALALILGIGVRFEANAESSDVLQEQIDALKQQESELITQIQALEDSLAENTQQINDMVERKNSIDRQVFLLQLQIENTNDQIRTYSVLIADTQEELEEAEQRHGDLHSKYIERVRTMEEEGKLSYWSILFRANSFTDFLDRINMIQQIAAADNRRLEELKSAREEVARVQSELQTHKADLGLTQQNLQDQQQTLEEKRSEADSLLQELLSKGEEYQELMAQSELKQEQLMQELAQKEQAYDEAVYQEWLATSVPETTQPTHSAQPEGGGDPAQNDSPASDSEWLTPVPWYVLTSPFGMRPHPILNTWRMHNGVDLACSAGTPIYATRSGIVSVASYQENGAGNYVQLDHGDGYRSIYMHMTYYIVSPGQYVNAGQTIGYVGSTGLSDGNHLHFGISYNGTYVNPMEFID